MCGANPRFIFCFLVREECVGGLGVEWVGGRVVPSVGGWVGGLVKCGSVGCAVGEWVGVCLTLGKYLFHLTVVTAYYYSRVFVTQD